MAGEKARREHANHMPGQYHCGVAKRQAADLHGQGRGSHQQIHHAIPQSARKSGHGKHRLAHDLAQRSARGCACCFFKRRWRKINPCQKRHRQQSYPGQCQIRTGKGHAGEVTGQHRQIGPSDCTQQTTGHDPGNGFGLTCGWSQFCRGKAVQLRIGVIKPGNDRGQHQQPKVAVGSGIPTQQSRAKGDGQTQLERHLSAPALLRVRHQRRGQRTAHHVTHDRQSRHPALGSQA